MTCRFGHLAVFVSVLVDMLSLYTVFGPCQQPAPPKSSARQQHSRRSGGLVPAALLHEARKLIAEFDDPAFSREVLGLTDDYEPLTARPASDSRRGRKA